MGHVWHYYYLYGLERVGRLSARRLIGEHDWYREGAEYLVRQQQESGYWPHPARGSLLAECQSDLSFTALPLIALAGWGLQHQVVDDHS